MHIALVYSKYDNLEDKAKKLNPHGADQMKDTVSTVEQALKDNGHKVTRVIASNTLLADIMAMEKVDVIFNLSAGIMNKKTQANIFGMLEMLEIPFVGSGLSTHVFGLHKEVTKILLRDAGIRTAGSQLFTTGDEEIKDDLKFPVMVKPEHEGSSVGVTENSKVHNKEDLMAIVKEKMETYNQVILVEEFLPGREFTVGVMGNDELEVFPIKEYIFDDSLQYDFQTVEYKADSTVPTRIPADLTDELRLEIEEMARGAFRALRCQNLARVDFRMDAEGIPYVTELNTLPGMQKGYSDFPTTAEHAGYTYEELIKKLVQLAANPRGYQ